MMQRIALKAEYSQTYARKARHGDKRDINTANAPRYSLLLATPYIVGVRNHLSFEADDCFSTKRLNRMSTQNIASTTPAAPRKTSQENASADQQTKKGDEGQPKQIKPEVVPPSKI